MRYRDVLQMVKQAADGPTAAGTMPAARPMQDDGLVRYTPQTYAQDRASFGTPQPAAQPMTQEPYVPAYSAIGRVMAHNKKMNTPSQAALRNMAQPLPGYLSSRMFPKATAQLTSQDIQRFLAKYPNFQRNFNSLMNHVGRAYKLSQQPAQPQGPTGPRNLGHSW